MHQLASDNKIYIGPFNGLSYLNVINLPDNFGTSCLFEPHSFLLPNYTNNIPSFPNYDLSALDNSPCDTLYLEVSHQVIQERFHLSPNPASSFLNITYQIKDEALFELFDVNGNVRERTILYPYFKNRIVWLTELENGLYFYRIFLDEQILKTGKLVVVR